ncbi:two-component system regulatory protein YycI [Pontibacillus salicampi]|uniref:Two-component system regulatory protein YycI n=1 Tax=Pontibacillus salicampi TaxID=1449801 RepID=A0ABV6LUH7_9BACI
MQWGQIKTLFILCFLILDIFLAHQFMQKQQESEYALLDSPNFEESLEAANITVGELPKETVKESYISAKKHTFTQSELDENDTILNNQDITRLKNDHVLVSTFDKPLDVNLESAKDVIESTVTSNVMFGDRYTFWNYNEEEDVLIFFQNYQDKPFYYNENAMIMAKANEEGHITGYVQTLVDDVSDTGEPKELINPMQAVEKLYNQNELFEGDNVTGMSLGYHTLWALEGAQIFSPTWKLAIQNGEESRNHYVNGVEGQLISTDQSKFIEQAIKNLSIELEAISGEEKE